MFQNKTIDLAYVFEFGAEKNQCWIKITPNTKQTIFFPFPWRIWSQFDERHSRCYSSSSFCFSMLRDLIRSIFYIKFAAREKKISTFCEERKNYATADTHTSRIGAEYFHINIQTANYYTRTEEWVHGKIVARSSLARCLAVLVFIQNKSVLFFMFDFVSHA